MAIWRTRWFAVVITGLVLSAGVNLMAAPPMGVGALTARQYIKDKVVDALADGNISPGEYEEIFSKAQETLQPQELAGLQRTMDRLMAQTNSGRVAESASLPLRSNGKYLDRNAWRESRGGRLFNPMPYYEPSRAPRPVVGGMAGSLGRRLPYIERPQWNGNRVRQLVGGFPRLNEIYPERPILLSSKGRGGYIVRTTPAPAPAPQVRQTAVRPNRFSASGASRSSPTTRKTSFTETMPEVETPVALAPLPDDEVNLPDPEGLPAPRVPQRRGPDYRTSRTAYLESLRSR
jgi:hypothetical protein